MPTLVAPSILAADFSHLEGEIHRAEEAGADILLSCDDRFCRTAQRHAKQLRVMVRNPLDWFDEVEHATDAR